MAADLRAYLEARTALPAGFSPDGSKLGVLSNLTGTMQLYRLPVEGGDLVAVTNEVEPVAGAYLPDTDAFLVAMDAGGNEQHGIYRVADSGGPLESLAADPAVKHVPGPVSRDGKQLAYACNARSPGDFDIHVMDLATGTARAVIESGGYWMPFSFSPDGRWLAVTRATERTMDNELYLVDVGGDGHVTEIAAHDEPSQLGAPAWLPDSRAFFFTTDVGRDIAGVARYDVATGEETLVLDTEWEAQCRIDWPGNTLLVALNEDGYSRLLRFDPFTMELRGEVPLPGRGVVTAPTFSRDGRFLAFDFVSPTEPGDVWLVDLAAGTAPVRMTAMPTRLDAKELVEPTLHRYESFDGESIPVFLYSSRDPAGAPYPVVVIVHGGPEGQSRPVWNGVIQYLVAHGYAVAVPNVRGSTGYGKRFTHLDDIEKRLDSVADLAGLHDWLAGRPAVDESRAALFGGSYGGYMVLAGLTFQPDRWAAGVDIVGISSLVTFLENTSAYRRKIREREYGSLATHRQFLHDVSPLTHIDKLRAPLFIVHGANDPRVPLSEAEQIHAVLQDKGVPCEVLVYGDEGHGLAKLANRLDAYPRATAFLDKVLRPR